MTKIAFWVVPALLVAAVIKLISGMPWWAAGLIGLFAMGANILVARVEDAQHPDAADLASATLGRRFIRGTFRLAAILIGIAAIAIGITAFGDAWPSPGWWGQYLAPVGMALFGIYLLAYGITGRDKPFMRRRL